MGINSIKVPDVGEGVAEVELVEWHVKPGDHVREDDVLAEVMTDKAMVEIPSLYDGQIVSLGAKVGETLVVGAELLSIEYAGENTNVKNNDSATQSQSDTSVENEPLPASESEERTATGTTEREAVPTRTSSSGTVRAPRPEGQTPLASPSVRGRAREAGIDLRQVPGSGPAGRITNADLDAIFSSGPEDASRSSLARREGTEEIRVIGLRRKIADRMALANARIPHITVVEEIDVNSLDELRTTMNATRGEKPKLTLLPFISAALSRALVGHPEMNAHFDDDAGVVTRHAAVHIGIATMTENGLLVPVLRHAEMLGPFAIATEISRLAETTRVGKATRDELTGSTITISSLGPLGAVATTPIINHPEVAILGINKMAVRPMWNGSQFIPRKMINLSASFDHRVVDGWDAASFIAELKRLLENPALIFLETE